MGFEVHRIAPLRDFKTKKLLPLFLCDLFRNELFVKIYEVTELSGYQVNVRLYRNNRAKICFRCQRYGHSSDICKLDLVCMKCSGNHPSKGCNVPRDQIKCPNCSLQHCSNYSKCPKNPKVIQETRKKKQEAVDDKNNSSNPTTAPRPASRKRKIQQAAPPLDSANFPPLVQPRWTSTTKQTTSTAENVSTLPASIQSDQLDITIHKLKKSITCSATSRNGVMKFQLIRVC